MYLPPQRVLHLQCVMELLAARLPGNELRQQLARPLLGLLDADFFASYVWDEGAGRFVDGVALNVDLIHWRRYEDHFQFEDPLTPRLWARRVPTRVTDVMAQRDLTASSFFNEFLHPDGLHWGINAYAHNGRQHLGDLRIWRRANRPNFDDNDLAVLNMIYPALTRSLSLGTGVPARGTMPDPTRLSGELSRYAGLSQREGEVVALAYEGLPDKDIARHLGIGFTTVRTHLASAFRKLGCDSRTKLARRLEQLSQLQ